MAFRGAAQGFVLLALCLGLMACVTRADRTYPKALGSPALPPYDGATASSPAMAAVTGHWEGESSADCIGDTTANPGRCHAMQKITLTMLQQGNQITGYYTCAYGNEICRNLDETGVIRNGTMTGRRLLMRVMLGDGSMCFFTGLPTSNVLEGRYSCLQGGGLIERGAFHTERSY